MTRKQAIEWIRSRNGKMFGVIFTKRSTGEQREMVCRVGVKSKLKGGEPAYDFQEKGLIPVFDMQKQEYRSIPLDAIIALKVDGDWELVTD